jgi:hypothetical protein
VAVDLAAPRARAFARSLTLARVAALPAHWVLAATVAVSFAVRWLLAFAHSTPLYFADEYIYSTLAYELAQTGRPTIRGESASFPALLEPLLTAPFWLSGDPELALRLTQGLNALAMSLAAIPVYLLARKLGLGKWFALGSAGVAVVVPDLFYVSFILGEPIAYPLVMAAVYAGVCALDRPTRRAQVAFVAFSGLAAFARIQFVVLPVALLAAALVVERGSVRNVVSRLRLTLGLLALPVVGALALGPGRVVGYYRDIAQFDLHPTEFLGWLATDAMLLAYATGWVLLPGALVGLALALARPRARVEQAFAALTAFLAAGLFVEAGFYAVNASLEPGGRFQERYLFTLLPLVAPAFGLYLRRARSYRGAIAVIAFALLAVSARFPLAGYTSSHGRQDSPFLIGVYRIERSIGYANGSALIAIAVALLSLVAVATAIRRGRAALIALALSAAFLASVSYGAFSYDRLVAERARTSYLPPDARWVDHANVGDVTLVNTPGALRELALEQMFWNRSITELALLRRAERVDAFASPPLRVAANGALYLRGEPLERPLLFNRYAMAAQLQSAERVARSPLFDLWRPRGAARLSLLAGGHYFDGWLAYNGWFTAWPDASGRLEGRLLLTVSLPKRAPRTTIRLRAPGIDTRMTLRPGQSRTLAFRASQRTAWTLRFKTEKGGAYLSDGRAVSVRATRVEFERRGSAAAGSTQPI